MPHSYNRIWIHAIWATKERQPLIASIIEQDLFDFMKSEFEELGCPVSIINGMPDHVHCLFLLNPQKPITDIVKQIKGSSSHYINQQNTLPYKFAWQTGYASFSVSDSIHTEVYRYIKNQKQHHKSQNLEQEYRGFLDWHGLEADNPWG